MVRRPCSVPVSVHDRDHHSSWAREAEEKQLLRTGGAGDGGLRKTGGEGDGGGGLVAGFNSRSGTPNPDENENY